MIDLNEHFYDPVKRIADTETQRIDASIVSRVLKSAAQYLHSLDTCSCLAVLAAWLKEHHEADPGGQ